MSKPTPSAAVTARSYTSPTLVLLAMDWPGGAERPDFLGFAILRAPGFHKGEKDAWLANKIGFAPPTRMRSRCRAIWRRSRDDAR